MAEQPLEISPASSARLHTGSCHCGRVRYQVSIDTRQGGRCNCSICTKISQLGSSVKPEAFELLAGADSISEYVWGHQIGRRAFCRHCGVHCFGSGHLAELGGDFVSINYNTLDDVDPVDVKVIYWDGRHDNWHAGPSDQPWRISEREAQR